MDVAKAGYRKQIVGLAESVACDKGRMTGMKNTSDGWFRRFMQRQLQLSLRKGDPTANVRMDCLTMPLNHSAPKIVTGRGHKKVRYRTSGNKSQITVIGCVSATGHACHSSCCDFQFKESQYGVEKG